MLDEIESTAVEISEPTRREIIDHFSMREFAWSGRLQDDEFLARLYNLAEMPSTDYRFKNAAGDIHQHTVRNNDWEPDWVFHDARFNLLFGPDDAFLRFLAETLHPTVRVSIDDARALADVYNQTLAPDGWQLVEGKLLSGRPVYVPRRAGRAVVFDEPTGWEKVDRQVSEVRQRLDAATTEEQYQAVGLLCREVLISAAQATFDSGKHPVPDGIDVSETDARRMLDAVLGVELAGASNEEARAHAKAAVKLANALQHKRMADFRTAALCAEATISVVNILAILAGRRRSAMA